MYLLASNFHEVWESLGPLCKYFRNKVSFFDVYQDINMGRSRDQFPGLQILDKYRRTVFTDNTLY